MRDDLQNNFDNSQEVTTVNAARWLEPNQPCLVCIKFFKKFWEDLSPFCGATDTPIVDVWLHLLWVSKLEWAALFALGQGVCFTNSQRFTSGATHVDLLMASMATSRLPT